MSARVSGKADTLDTGGFVKGLWTYSPRMPVQSWTNIFSILNAFKAKRRSWTCEAQVRLSSGVSHMGQVDKG